MIMNQPPEALPGVTLVGGGPGAWDLITVRGMRALQNADVILADHLGPSTELEKLCDLSGKTLIDAAKLPYGRQMAQEKINELMVEHAHQGSSVVRLKGGDPYVFGRGFEEVQACQEAGIPCTVVPGVTSAISVPGAVGVPDTAGSCAFFYRHLWPRTPWASAVSEQLGGFGTDRRNPCCDHGCEKLAQYRECAPCRWAFR